MTTSSVLQILFTVLTNSAVYINFSMNYLNWDMQFMLGLAAAARSVYHILVQTK